MGVPDLRQESRAGEWRQAAQKFNIQGTILFPILYKDHCFGLALLGSHLWGGSPRSEETAKLSMILRALGAALHQVEADAQRYKAKRPDQPLVALLTQLGILPTLTKRLEAVVQQTQEFVVPARTHVYWFEPQKRYFWRRTSNLAKRSGRQEAAASLEIAVQDVNGFYQTLSAGGMIVVGEAQSTLTEITGRLMQLLKARSLLAAPILWQGELLGFLAVEGTEPRIWEEAEKTYLRGAAQLIALTAPLAQMEQTVQQTQQDQALTTGLTRAICSQEGWNDTLQQCAEQLCQRLQVERFLVLLPSPKTGRFSAYYQHQGSLRPFQESLDRLSEVDWQMLQRSVEPIAIQNLSEDLKLLAWRQTLLDLGVRSLLVCSTSPGRPESGLLLIGHETSRTWSTQERQLVQGISQQLGLILYQWHLQCQGEQQQQLQQAMRQGLAIIQRAQNLKHLQQVSLQQFTQILQVPVAALISWPLNQYQGQRQGWIITSPTVNSQFALRTEVTVAVDTDPLIQAVLEERTAGKTQAGLLLLSVEELAPETRAWLHGSDIGQIGAIALQTAPEHQPAGVVLVADDQQRRWSDLQLEAFVTLVQQLALLL